MTDGWDLVVGPATWDIVIPTDDESIVRRRRALAPIQVLTDIERNKSQLDGGFWQRYDLFNIALGVIDQVALAMGISAGRTWDETVDYATGQAARQAPDAGRDEWRAVAERVLVSLVTTDVETVPYLVHGAGGATWLAQRFRLLYVQPAGDGSEYLRASEQAINIFVEALDLDIEAAQIANEAQLRALITRGAVESAVQIARHARYRSIQYQERIRRIVADTLIDPDTHDWIGDVPSLLDSALGHVRERLDAEAGLLDAVADRRAEIHDTTRLTAANQLIEILRECRHRHDELHGHLIGARGRLREALDDRFVRPARSTHRVDLASDLLTPYLVRTVKDAEIAAERLVATVGGITIRWWPSLATITDELCAPARMPDQGEEFEPPEYDDVEKPEWWEPYEAAAESMFESIEEPIRLSQLVARAESVAERIADADGDPLDSDLLVAATIHSAHRAWAAHLAGRSAGDRVVVAATTGDLLDAYGVRSADLLLIPGEITVDIAATEVRRSNDRVDDEGQDE